MLAASRPLRTTSENPACVTFTSRVTTSGVARVVDRCSDRCSDRCTDRWSDVYVASFSQNTKRAHRCAQLAHKFHHVVGTPTDEQVNRVGGENSFGFVRFFVSV